MEHTTTTQHRNKTNETLELLTSYEGTHKVLIEVVKYLEGNKTVMDANALGAGLAAYLEHTFGSEELAQQMNDTPHKEK